MADDELEKNENIDNAEEPVDDNSDFDDLDDSTEIDNSENTESKRVYKIGEYTFYTLREYRDAQEDLRKISVIQEKLNIQDPETAVKIYKSIRQGEITFKSPIGEKF